MSSVPEGDRAAVLRTTKVRTKSRGDGSWSQRQNEPEAETREEEEKPWLAEVRARRLNGAPIETSPVSSPVKSTPPPVQADTESKPAAQGYLIRGVFTKLDKPVSSPSYNGTSKPKTFIKKPSQSYLKIAPHIVRNTSETPEGQLSPEEQEKRKEAAIGVLKTKARQRSYVSSAAKLYEAKDTPSDPALASSTPSFVATRVETVDDDEGAQIPEPASTVAQPAVVPPTSTAFAPTPTPRTGVNTTEKITNKSAVIDPVNPKATEVTVEPAKEEPLPQSFTKREQLQDVKTNANATTFPNSVNVASSEPQPEDKTPLVKLVPALKTSPAPKSVSSESPAPTSAVTEQPVPVPRSAPSVAAPTPVLTAPTQTVTEPTVKAEPEPEEETVVVTKAEAEPEPEEETVVVTKAEAEPEPEEETVVVTEAEAEPEPEEETVVVTEAEPEPETEHEPEVKLETKPDPEQESIPGPQPELKPSAEPSSNPDTLAALSDTLISLNTNPSSAENDEQALAEEERGSADVPTREDSVEREPAPALRDGEPITADLSGFSDDGMCELVPSSPGRWSQDSLSGLGSESSPAKTSETPDLHADDVVTVNTEARSLSMQQQEEEKQTDETAVETQSPEEKAGLWSSYATTTVTKSSSADPFDPYPIGTASHNSASDSLEPIADVSINRQIQNEPDHTADQSPRSWTTTWEVPQQANSEESQEPETEDKAGDQETVIMFERKSTDNDSPWDRWTSPTVYTITTAAGEEEEEEEEEEEVQDEERSATYSTTVVQEEKQVPSPEPDTKKPFVYVKEYVDTGEMSLHNPRDTRSSWSDDFASSIGYSYSSPSSYTRVSSSSSCTYCGKQVGNEAKITIEHLNINCHPECFKCDVCNRPMGDLLDSMFSHNKKVHCESCYSTVI